MSRDSRAVFQHAVFPPVYEEWCENARTNQGGLGIIRKQKKHAFSACFFRSCTSTFRSIGTFLSRVRTRRLPSGVTGRDYLGRTALQLAVLGEHYDCIQLLLEKSRLEVIEEGLLHAIKTENVKICDMFLGHPIYSDPRSRLQVGNISVSVLSLKLS
ncbi:short transient receptor potential channel [Plakobranchus ocellatus]|uniref:Short transient receptor potential channel n=1 Tax=Plakobranchus ocellatus TaxID=259542 RepID=A0AAV4C726_9GAST|nr:short transient receptor potential channel [Plakobranchus ocellatus]